MFEPLLHKVFEIESQNCEILIPNGLLVDKYEKFGLAIINHANEIRKEAAEQEKKARAEQEEEVKEEPQQEAPQE